MSLLSTCELKLAEVRTATGVTFWHVLTHCQRASHTHALKPGKVFVHEADNASCLSGSLSGLPDTSRTPPGHLPDTSVREAGNASCLSRLPDTSWTACESTDAGQGIVFRYLLYTCMHVCMLMTHNYTHTRICALVNHIAKFF